MTRNLDLDGRILPKHRHKFIEFSIRFRPERRLIVIEVDIAKNGTRAYVERLQRDGTVTNFITRSSAGEIDLLIDECITFFFNGKAVVFRIRMRDVELVYTRTCLTRSNNNVVTKSLKRDFRGHRCLRLRIDNG